MDNQSNNSSCPSDRSERSSNPNHRGSSYYLENINAADLKPEVYRKRFPEAHPHLYPKTRKLHKIQRMRSASQKKIKPSKPPILKQASLFHGFAKTGQIDINRVNQFQRFSVEVSVVEFERESPDCMSMNIQQNDYSLDLEESQYQEPQEFSDYPRVNSSSSKSSYELAMNELDDMAIVEPKEQFLGEGLPELQLKIEIGPVCSIESYSQFDCQPIKQISKSTQDGFSMSEIETQSKTQI